MQHMYEVTLSQKGSFNGAWSAFESATAFQFNLALNSYISQCAAHWAGLCRAVGDEATWQALTRDEQEARSQVSPAPSPSLPGSYISANMLDDIDY